MELKAVDFASEKGDNLANYGLANPAIRVWLTKQKDKNKLSFALGEKNEKYYAKRDDKPIIYEVTKDIFERLNHPSREYRSLDLVGFNRFDLKRIKIENGPEKIELVKSDENKWSDPSNPKADLDSDRVDQFLSKLQDAKVTQYLADEGHGYGLDKSKYRIQLFESKDGKEIEKGDIKFGQKKGTEIVAKRKDLPFAFTLKEGLYKDLEKNKVAFLKEKKTSKKE